jgi:ADP-ribosylglycohydrolase/RimJ/RimL family protein N-acetyltransferase
MRRALEIVHADLEMLAAARADPAQLSRLLGGAAIAEGWLVFPDSIAFARAKLETHPDWRGFWTTFFVATLGARERVLVGLGGYQGPPSEEGVVEIGYSIAPAHRGRGLATQAARALTHVAFLDPRVEAVEAHTLAEPNASTRVLEKVGMTRVAERVLPGEGPVWQWRLRRGPPVDRIVGCLLGGALGDALGYPLEFAKPGRSIVERFGTGPPARLCFSPDAKGLVSDDTQMTIFSADGLVRARLAGAARATPFLLSAYQSWYATQAMTRGEPPKTYASRGWLLAEPRLFARRAPGNTCLSAVAQSFTRGSLASVEDPPNGSKGCGAVMRSAPFGLLARSREEAFTEARDAGVLTHGHPSGDLSGAYLGSLMYDLARGAPLRAAMAAADDLVAREVGHEELEAIVERARALAALGPPGLAAIERLGGGWTGEEALAIALVCALTAEGDVAGALWRSVAHGGDSDSTGSLTGNLLGATLGAAALPQGWLEELEMRDVVERSARELWAVTLGGHGVEGGGLQPLDGRRSHPDG